MKRSEAQTKIYEYLSKNSIYQISSAEILDLVEGLGMLPPTRTASYRSFRGGEPINVWEPEDEK